MKKKQNPIKGAKGAKFESALKKAARELNEDPDWEKVHYTLDAKDNLPLQVMNEVLRKKVN